MYSRKREILYGGKKQKQIIRRTLARAQRSFRFTFTFTSHETAKIKTIFEPITNYNANSRFSVLYSLCSRIHYDRKYNLKLGLINVRFSQR